MDPLTRPDRRRDPRDGGVLMSQIAMPRLSDSMQDGTIVRWLKADGDTVARGEEIVEIETDKATMAYEADSAGVLRILADEGATVAVGDPIATIGDPATEHASTPAPAPFAATTPVPEPRPEAPAAARPVRLSASPVARRTAAKLGVALDALAGTGPLGRILKADVLAAKAPATEPAAATTTVKGLVVTSELTRIQQTVARRMSESKATVPDFAVDVDVDMTAALALREQLKSVADPAPSLNDIIVKTVAQALRRHPRVNGSYHDGRFETYDRVNVGIAVATDDALVVPVVHDTDRLSLGEVGAASRRLAGRVRSGEITPPELAGGTFTVSNLGMFGVDRFAGIVNAPQAAILCVGAVARRPAVVADGSLAARDQLTLTLVSDHRILYGADAARFLADVRATLEAPAGLLL